MGSVVNLALTALKLVSGIIGRSGAMIADGVHSLSDLVSDFVVLVFVRIAGIPKDAGHHYGHGKFETFATMIIGGLLLWVSILLLKSGLLNIWKVISGETLEAPGYIALAAALASIACKEILFRKTYKVGEETRSDVVKANAWHHRSDALSSIATAVGIGGAILLGAKGRILDPLAAMLVSVFIVREAVKLIIPSFNELMDCSLPKEVEDEILKTISECEGVSDPHHLYTRNIGSNYAIEVHVRVDGNISLNEAHSRATNVERLLKERFGPDTHVSVHVEPVKLSSK